MVCQQIWSITWIKSQWMRENSRHNKLRIDAVCRLVSDCTTWQDSNVVYLSFRSTRGLPSGPRAAAKNLKSLLQADRIRFFDLQLPAWNRRKHHQASTADDFHIIFRTFEELWQLLLLCVFRVGSTRCVAVQSWVEDLVISSRIRDSVMRSTWYVQYEPKTGHHGQGPKICLNFKTSLAPSIVLPLKGVVPAPFLCWRAAYCEEELTWQQSR